MPKINLKDAPATGEEGRPLTSRHFPESQDMSEMRLSYVATKEHIHTLAGAPQGGIECGWIFESITAQAGG